MSAGDDEALRPRDELADHVLGREVHPQAFECDEALPEQRIRPGCEGRSVSRIEAIYADHDLGRARTIKAVDPQDLAKPGAGRDIRERKPSRPKLTCPDNWHLGSPGQTLSGKVPDPKSDRDVRRKAAIHEKELALKSWPRAEKLRPEANSWRGRRIRKASLWQKAPIIVTLNVHRLSRAVCDPCLRRSQRAKLPRQRLAKEKRDKDPVILNV